MKFLWHQLEIHRVLNILQQPFLFRDFVIDSALRVLYALLHCLCLCADVCPRMDIPVRLFQRIIPDLRLFVFVRPSVYAVRSHPQLADLLQMLFVLGTVKVIRSLLIFPPARKASLLYADRLPVQYEDMIDAGIQKLSVM